MKRILYIISFGLLGLLVATILHGVIELVTLDLIFNDSANADSFWWQEWQLVHAVAGGALWIIGCVLGLLAGYTWWDEYGSKSGAFGLRS